MNLDIYEKNNKVSLGRAGILLAMTSNREEEILVKEWLKTKGIYKATATEISGVFDEYKQKIIKSIVSAAVNTNIIYNNPRQIHAVTHAAMEANEGILLAQHLENPSIKMKAAIISDGEWIVVAMFGVTALCLATNHERSCLGLMHL